MIPAQRALLERGETPVVDAIVARAKELGPVTVVTTRTELPPIVWRDDRRDLIKTRASAPRPPAPKPAPPAAPKTREREPLGVGMCSSCRTRTELFRHRVEGLCRNCHPFGATCAA